MDDSRKRPLDKFLSKTLTSACPMRCLVLALASPFSLGNLYFDARLNDWAERTKVQHVSPASDTQIIDKKFYCPKQFVPGRAGGFKHEAGKQGCCVLDASLEVAESIYMMHECGFAFGKGFKPAQKLLGFERKMRFERECHEAQPLPHASNVRRCCASSSSKAQEKCEVQLAGYNDLLTPAGRGRDEASVFAMYKECVDTKEYERYFARDPAYAECCELRMMARQEPAWNTKEKIPASHYACETHMKPTPGQLKHQKSIRKRALRKCRAAEAALFKIVHFLQTAAYDMYEHAGSDLTPKSKKLLLEPGLPQLEHFMQKHNGMEYDLVDKDFFHAEKNTGPTEKAYLTEVHKRYLRKKKGRLGEAKFHKDEEALESRDLAFQCEKHPFAFEHCRHMYSHKAWNTIVRHHTSPKKKRERCLAIIKRATPKDIKNDSADLQGCWEFLGPRDEWNDPEWDFFCDMHPKECAAERQSGLDSEVQAEKDLFASAIAAATNAAKARPAICRTQCVPACYPCSHKLVAAKRRSAAKKVLTTAQWEVKKAKAEHVSLAQFRTEERSGAERMGRAARMREGHRPSALEVLKRLEAEGAASKTAKVAAGGHGGDDDDNAPAHASLPAVPPQARGAPKPFRLGGRSGGFPV